MSINTTQANITVEQDLVGDYVFVFKQELLSAVESGASDLVIDMALVRILGSSAIGVLACAVNTLKLSGGTITLQHLNPDILRVLKLMGMTKTFVIQDHDHDTE